MNRKVWLVLASAAVLGLMAGQVFARGGGHGGGHHGGGHHGHHASHHSTHHHSGHHNHHHVAHHGGHHGWGGAGWGGVGWGGAGWNGGWGRGWGVGNAWAPVALGTAAAWMGVNALTPATAGYGQPVNVYTSDNGSVDTDGAGQPQAIASEPDAAIANELAKSGATDPPQDDKLLPLGIFSLAPKDQTEASAMLQLSLSKEGVLRGSYYDILSNQSHPVRGAVDRKTQRAAFTFGQNGKAVFETSLANLTQDVGPLSVHYADGKTSDWTLARYDGKEAADHVADDEDGDASDENGNESAGEDEAEAPGTPSAGN
jgi:hypothetical protein